jgi:hypothetical protein
MNARRSYVWCAVLVLEACGAAVGDDPAVRSNGLAAVSESRPVDPLEARAAPMSYSDTEGDDPKKAGCLYGYSDAMCLDDEPRVRGDECSVSDPTEIREAFAERNGTACAANTCCPDYKVIAYDCPTVCGHPGKNRYKCKTSNDHCGTGTPSAYCDCTGGGGEEIGPPIEVVGYRGRESPGNGMLTESS